MIVVSAQAWLNSINRHTLIGVVSAPIALSAPPTETEFQTYSNTAAIVGVSRPTITPTMTPDRILPEFDALPFDIPASPMKQP